MDRFISVRKDLADRKFLRATRGCSRYPTRLPWKYGISTLRGNSTVMGSFTTAHRFPPISSFRLKLRGISATSASTLAAKISPTTASQIPLSLLPIPGRRRLMPHRRGVRSMELWHTSAFA